MVLFTTDMPRRLVTAVLALAWSVIAGAVQAQAPTHDHAEPGLADAARGGQIYDSRCSGCHSIDDNGPGPRHRDVYGRQAGTQPGYDYSAELKQSHLTWNDVTLDLWLKNPNALVPGNKMVVRLVPEARDRSDVVAYLYSLSVKAPAAVGRH